MIFIGSMNDNESQRFLRQPDEIGGAETRHVYLMVSDADLVYARLKNSGAEMVIEIKDESYGGRRFTCRDPERRDALASLILQRNGKFQGVAALAALRPPGKG